MELQSTPFQELLPTSVRDDPKFAAAAATLDAMLAETDAQMKQAVIYARIDELEEPLLSSLAWQFHLEGYEGYAMAATLDAKRNLVRDAIMLHWHKGTRWSVERIFNLLGMQGAITEWWESPDDPDFNPYEFDIEIDASQGVGESFYSDCDRLVDALKNIRSHRRKLKIIMDMKGEVPFLGCAFIGGTTGTIRPFVASDIDLTPCAVFLGAGTWATQRITIYPLNAV